MEFRLVYDGKLKSKTSTNLKDTQALRRVFHSQLKMLWTQEPLASSQKQVDHTRILQDGDISLIENVGSFVFAPLVSDKWYTHAELDVLFLRPSAPGSLVGHGGDLDNRIKTLLDGLRMPSKSELPAGDIPGSDETPFFCLLKDDALVTALAVRTDRLLRPSGNNEVQLVIHVNVKPTKVVWANIGL